MCVKICTLIDMYYLSIQSVVYSMFIMTLSPEILGQSGILTVAFAVRLLEVAMLLTTAVTTITASPPVVKIFFSSAFLKLFYTTANYIILS